LDSGQKTKINKTKGFSGQVTENPLFVPLQLPQWQLPCTNITPPVLKTIENVFNGQ
jgi:hypothetical protein